MITTETEAHELDRAIDALLRGEGRIDVVESGLGATARLLHEVLPRFHPRFSFEDALSQRLARLGSPGEAVPAPIPFPAMAAGADDHDGRSLWGRYRRELVAGGAIASGVSIAIPLAGAALLKWRRSRSSSSAGGFF